MERMGESGLPKSVGRPKLKAKDKADDKREGREDKAPEKGKVRCIRLDKWFEFNHISTTNPDEVREMIELLFGTHGEFIHQVEIKGYKYLVFKGADFKL